MKINRNPAIAYQQGKKDGFKDGVATGFVAFSYLVLLGMHNTNSELEYLSEKQFKKFFLGTEAEVKRIFSEEYKNDPESLAEVAVYHINELRTKLGLGDKI